MELAQSQFSGVGLMKTGIFKTLVLTTIMEVLILCASAQCQVTKDTPGWFEFVIPGLDATQTPVDMSFLNPEPAGASGFVRIQDDHFVDGAGKRLRLLGTNLTFAGAFPDKDASPKIAAHMRKLGINVVRFHHMDNSPAPRGIWLKDEEGFDPEQLDKLDWIIYQLKQNGIYTNINLHVSRNYPGIPHDIRTFRYGKVLDHFYRPFIEMQKEYARALLTHENPYTGTVYTQEPALICVEINNENTLLRDWDDLLKMPDPFKSALLEQWRDWIGKHYRDTAHLRDEWGEDQSLEADNIAIPPTDAPASMRKDFWNFLFDTEMNYAQEMVGFLKDDLKVRGFVSVTQASYGGIAGVYREAEVADYTDMHSYWQHPRFPVRPWSRTDWNIPNTSMVRDQDGGTLVRLAIHRVYGKPFTVSEYDHPAPNHHTAEMFPMLASFAAFQDWDGIYQFNYDSRNWDQKSISGYFSMNGHPGKLAFLPIAAVMLRMKGVSAGASAVLLYAPTDDIIPQLTIPGANAWTAWTRAGATSATPIMEPVAVQFRDGESSLSKTVAEPTDKLTSSTGQIEWDKVDPQTALYTVNSPAVRAAVGYLCGRNVTLGDVRIEMSTTETNWASIAIAALDGKPIPKSDRILLVAAGRVENTNMGWNEDHTSVSDRWGTEPTVAEGIPATVIFTKLDGLHVQALDGTGALKDDVPCHRSDGGGTAFTIGAQYKTLWYLITRP